MDKNRTVKIIIAVLPGLILRLVLAPYTSGSDIPQFAGFADTLLRHGLKFYAYSDATHWNTEGWPYPWPYVYGPLLILLLGGIRLLAPTPVKTFYDQENNYHVYVPINWVTTVKLVYIGFDTVTALLVYRIVSRRSERLALPALILYYYNPMTIYISSIYGMLDMIPIAFLLAGILFWESRNNSTIAGVLWGLGASFKPSIILAVIPYTIGKYLVDRINGIKSITLTILIPIILISPFIIASPDSLRIFIHGLKMVGSPSYSSPVVYSFNGFSSIVFYAHDHLGVSVYKYLHLWPIPFIILYILSITVAMRDPLLSASLGYLTFTATYWRVNHQYLVPAVALILVSLPLLEDACSKFFTLTTGLLIGLWPLMYPISFWAWVHIENPNHHIVRLLQLISFNTVDDITYIFYSLSLTISETCLILCTSIPFLATIKLLRVKTQNHEMA